MTIELTVDEVREIVTELSASDAAISMNITIVGNKVDTCLEANYDADTAKAIKIYTVAYFSEKGANNKGSVTSQKWADGDSQQYSAMANGDNAYWDMLLQLDSAGCVSNAYKTNKVFAVTGRTSTYNTEIC